MNNKFYSDQDLIRNDADQWKAYNSNENTVVIAGPGSGKTRVLTLKAIKLCLSEMQTPSGIACISYSRETVRELKKRLREYDYTGNGNDFVGTLHGFSLIHILEPFSHLYPDYGIPLPLKIISNNESDQIYQGVLKELNITDRDVSKTDLDKQRSLSLEGASQVQLQFFEINVLAAELYEEKLKTAGFVDFISMINTATLMIREQDYIRKSLEAKFTWLLIDEYQDLGKALHEMVLELQAQTSIKIFAVGDMNQSIYGFNGAYPDFLDELNNLDDFNSIFLSSNYRSNQEIIEGSLDSLALAPPRLNYIARKRVNESANFSFITCEAEMQQQYEIVSSSVVPNLIAKGISYNEIGIIVGSGNEVRGMANSLNDVGTPFYIVKWQFTNSDVVQWLQDCAQWILDKTKQSFDEIFRFWWKLMEIHDDARILEETIIQKTLFYETLNSSSDKLTVLEWIEFIIDELNLNEVLMDSERYPEENNNLLLLVNEAKNANLIDAPLLRFANLGKPENEVTITTRHSAKGLEFEAVILLGMEEGRFPYYNIENDSREMAEAHRLCYVCVSRAKKECIMLRSRQYTFAGMYGPWTKKFQASRFWDILTAHYGTDENIIDAKDYQVYAH